MAHLNGATFWNEAIATCWKLSNTGEATFFKWILDMEKCGLPVPVSNVRHVANSLLPADLKSSSFYCELRVNRFVKSKYTHQYGYQRAKCEDSGLIESWLIVFRILYSVRRCSCVCTDRWGMHYLNLQKQQWPVILNETNRDVFSLTCLFLSFQRTPYIF